MGTNDGLAGGRRSADEAAVEATFVQKDGSATLSRAGRGIAMLVPRSRPAGCGYAPNWEKTIVGPAMARSAAPYDVGVCCEGLPKPTTRPMRLRARYARASRQSIALKSPAAR